MQQQGFILRTKELLITECNLGNGDPKSHGRKKNKEKGVTNPEDLR